MRVLGDDDDFFAQPPPPRADHGPVHTLVVHPWSLEREEDHELLELEHTSECPIETVSHPAWDEGEPPITYTQEDCLAGQLVRESGLETWFVHEREARGRDVGGRTRLAPGRYRVQAVLETSGPSWESETEAYLEVLS